MTVQEVPNPLVHKIELKPQQKGEMAATQLEQVLSQKESIAAKRYSAAELEKMALQSENDAANLRGEPPPHHPNLEDDDEDILERRRDRKRERLLNAARALIDSGTDPNVIARMMLQLPGEQPNVQAPREPTSILDLTEALKNLNDIADSRAPKNDGNERIMDLIREMREEAKETRGLVTKLLTEGVGNKQPHIDPLVAAKNQALAMNEMSAAMLEFAKAQGWRGPGETGGDKRKTVEELKEEHRHTEEMAKLGNDKEYKTSMAETLGDITERVGMGIGKQIRDSSVKTSTPPVFHQPEPGGIESYICECGEKIFAPPNATSVKCPNPKCGIEYNVQRGNVPPQADK